MITDQSVKLFIIIIILHNDRIAECYVSLELRRTFHNAAVVAQNMPRRRVEWIRKCPTVKVAISRGENLVHPE